MVNRKASLAHLLTSSAPGVALAQPRICGRARASLVNRPRSSQGFLATCIVGVAFGASLGMVACSGSDNESLDAAPTDAGALHRGDARIVDVGQYVAPDATTTGGVDDGAVASGDAGVGGDDAAGLVDAGELGDAGAGEGDAGSIHIGSIGKVGIGNPASVGYGARKTIAIDGLNTGNEWGDDTLLIRDPAGDEARFLGTNWCAHEAPWDYVALHAAWDETNLYVGIQFVNITDVLDPANFGSSEGSPIQGMDLVQFLAFNTVPGKGYSTGGDMWTKDQTFVGDDKPDFQLYFHSNFSQEGTYLGRWDSVAFVAATNGHVTPALTGAGGEFYVGSTLMGVDPHADDASPGDFGEADIDYLARGHNPNADTFFELQIPLHLLEITVDQLDEGTIGVFAANGDGSAVDSIPDDRATRSTPGVSASNSPLEWSSVDDDDAYSVPFAWIGTP
ncbi:MAG: hypothetical protein IPK13_23615 [Deltaproteobacteria bacterium]|nr:hypothetical protein [Deltaproteobacteria bacterium]